MLHDAAYTGLAYVIAFLINLVPAFMPSTWMVLAFFHIKFDAPLLPLTIGGALFSGLGRIVLARGTTYFNRRFRKKDESADEIKTYLDQRRNYVGFATFLYCLLPLPTNSLFVAAGVVEVSLLRVMIGFWAGRVVATRSTSTRRAKHSRASVTFSRSTTAVGRQSRCRSSVCLARWLSSSFPGRSGSCTGSTAASPRKVARELFAGEVVFG